MIEGHPSGFQFRFSDREGDVAPNEIYEFLSLLKAIDEAKRVLTEMGLDGIPTESGSSIAVTVINSSGLVAATVCLTMNVQYPLA